jgi:DNA-binding winged helix-turn-helix (wHTH) protein/tetratricopeptide (TPR) repeat protein
VLTVRYVRFGEFTLDLEAPELRRAGQPVRLPPQATRVLAMLAARPTELITRDEIQSRVWAGTIVAFDQSINTSIRQIRTALGDQADAPTFIETVPRRGYRFLARVEPATAALHCGAHVARHEVAHEAGQVSTEHAGSQRNGWTRATTAPCARRAALAFAAVAVLVAAIFVIRDVRRPAHAETPQPEPAARMAWARGQWLIESHGPGSMERAITEFEETVRLDPDFAPAHAALARALFWTGQHEAARAPATRALELDGRLAAAHLAAGDIALMSDRDFARARRHYDHAVAVSEEQAEAHVALGLWFAVRGQHDRAIASVVRAIELDPMSAIINSDAGLFHYWARRWEEAAHYCGVAADLQPDATWALGCLIDAHVRGGRFDLAAPRIARLLTLEDADSAVIATIVAGSPEQSLYGYRSWRVRHLDRYTNAFVRARVLVDAGEHGRALAELERAVDEKLPSALTLAVEPAFDALHGNARFDALVRRVLGSPVS